METYLRDHIALQELMARYVQAVDEGGSEQYFLDLFTEDGAMTSAVTGDNRGQDGLKMFWKSCEERRGKLQLRHFVSNYRIDIEGGEAKLKAYFVVFQTRIDVVPDERESSLRFVGTYDCDMRKQSEAWKIARRHVHIDSRS